MKNFKKKIEIKIALVAIYLIRFYQLFFSPIIGNNCRFYPSCSNYTLQAVKSYGFWKGIILGIKRIVRCRPGCEGGIDHAISDDNHNLSKLKGSGN